MARNSDAAGGPTRREYVKYGSAVVAGGLLAGCTSGDDQGTVPPTDADTATATDTATGTGTATASPTGEETTPRGATATGTATSTPDGPYSVEMAPMGEVTFEEPPETVFTRLTHLAGMAFALGRGDDVNAMHAPDYYDALWNQFTPRLPGVELDWTGLYSSWEPSKERLYDLDSDVHLADPAGIDALDGWSRDDVDEIAENVSPWFGNYYSDRHAEPPTEWADRYQYYGLWEMFERVARVFRERDRYDAFAAIRADLLDTIESALPPSSERPTAVMAGLTEVESPWVYKTDVPGFLAAHVRPLGAREALGDDVSSGSQIDMEGMAAADPDVIFALGGMHPGTDMPGIRSELAEHPIGRQLAAVENDRVYAQGARYQGPILNLFQLEMTAKQLYPDAFGEWPAYAEGPYPEIPEDEQLFDRQRVADVINGDV